MEAIDSAKLDFAYKYPVSKEAREVISQLDSGLDEKYIRLGAMRVEDDINSDDISFTKTSMSELKKSSIISYVYSRMVISAINSRYALDRYVKAEARRIGDALLDDTSENMLRIASQLHVPMEESNSEFVIGFEKYLVFSPRTPVFSLVHQKLDKGKVYISRELAARISETSATASIAQNLPIKPSEIPKKVIDYSKTVKLPKQKISISKANAPSYSWIDRLISTPIPDIRHRAVNLILAPYFVNVKGLSEAEAAKAINDYIERCRQINPETRINSSYIMYQCRYAKSKGLKPLSYTKAKELLKGIIDLE